MLDPSSERDRLISAALSLAAERPWSKITLADIAERAGCTLVQLKAHFSSKGEILAAFSRLVDNEVLQRAPRRTEGQSPRDALFEVVMCRLDVLEPYKSALKSILDSGLPEPALLGRLFAAQGWMLEAAGINSSGIDGGLRAAGLATVYASVMRTWLEDDDPGHARTMAALDRRLRRGQRTLERIEEVCSGLSRLGTGIADVLRRPWQRSSAPPPTDAAPTPPPSSA